LKRIISKTNQPASNSTATNNGNGASATNSNSNVAPANNKSKPGMFEKNLLYY
jgi:hypothetical protein